MVHLILCLQQRSRVPTVRFLQLFPNLAHPALHGIATKYAMSEQTWHHGMCSFLQLFSQTCVHTSADLRTLIFNASHTFDRSNKDTPVLSSERAQCQSDLEEFLIALENVRLGHAPLPRTTGFCGELSLIDNPLTWSPDNVSMHSPWGHQMMIWDQATETRAPDIAEFEISDQCNLELWDKIWYGKPKAEITMLALIGWLYYGQVLASSFGTYVRTFIILLQTGLNWT